MKHPIPANEPERIEALHSYCILDTAPEAAFDDLAKLVAHICEVPMAAISLVDSDRQWFKSRLGIRPTQTGRDNSFCAYGIVQEEDLFIVPDARADAQLSKLPLVQKDPRIRFYAGARLTDADGHALGMICVMDTVPRQLDARQKETLQTIAKQVVAQLELHRELAAHQQSRQLLEMEHRALAKSEALYHSLVENLPLYILRKDREGRIIFVNHHLCDALHRLPSAVLGRTDFDLLPREIAAKFRSNDEHVMATGEVVETEETIPMEGGHAIHVQVTTLPLYDDHGAACGVQVISRDFTERYRLEIQLVEARERLERRVLERTSQLEKANLLLKRAQSEASDWKERYDLIVNAAGLAVYDIDRVTGEVLWSVGSEKILGLAPEHMNRASNDWLQLVHSQDRDAVLRGIEGAIDNGLSFDLQYRLNYGPDHARWIHDRGLVVPNAQGRCIRVLGMMQDITQRKLAEDTMREQARLLDLSQDAIMVRDLKNRVLYWNQTAQRLYGWTYGEALGRPINELLLRGEMAHMPIAQAEALDKGEWSGEVKVYSKDGRELTINSRWTLLRDHDGRPNAFLVTHTDLTEHKLLEAKFLRAQRLESVGALASGIAHDLNNVFTPILISTQLLTEGLDEATRANMIQILNNSAQRGSEMVKQVLTFARGCEAGSSLVQLKHLISDLERMMRDTFPSNIRIEKTFAPSLALVQGDATQLYQVLINLCVNARDAMPKGGTLRLEAENVELEPSDGEGKPAPGVCVTVVDTGSGMSPEIQRKIFEPFFTTKEIGKGTGLGLSTVMSLVKAHGGRLEVQSEEGLGTRFKVFLPAVLEKQCAPPPSEKKSQGGKGELLLIVDDESAIREIVKTTLEAYDYNVLVAKNGRDALAVYAEWERDIALVITDIAMPELDGFGMIRELRSAKPEVKVIAMTALCDQEKLDQLGRDGVIVLSKPVSSEQLLKSIHQVLHPAPQPAALEPSAR